MLALISVLGWNESVITDGWRFEQSEHADLRLIWRVMRPSFVKGNWGFILVHGCFCEEKKKKDLSKNAADYCQSNYLY